MTEFRVIYHEPICPDCGSFDIDRRRGRHRRRPHRDRAHLPSLRHGLAAGLRHRLDHPVMTGQLGVIYMLHFQPALQATPAITSAGPKTSSTGSTAHASGHGARLVAVITQAGIGFTLVRICEGTRRRERAIKNAGGAVRLLPGLHPPPA